MAFLVAQLHNLTGGTKRSKELFRLGMKASVDALNSPQFKEAVHNFKWVDPKTGVTRFEFKNDEYSYVDKVTRDKFSKEVSRQELYNLIMSGWDKFDQVTDGDIDIKTDLFYKRWSNAIGYTYPSTFKTWINTKFWTGSEKRIVALIAGNIVHEYMHNMGFDHAFDWNPTREFTVPYAIGRIVNRIVSGDYTPGPAVFKKVCSRSWRTLWSVKNCKWERIRKY